MKTREQILADFDRVIACLESIVVDIQRFNRREEFPPMDCEQDRVLLSLMRQARDAFASDDRPRQVAIQKRIDAALQNFVS